jgi:hypothetical protein
MNRGACLAALAAYRAVVQRIGGSLATGESDLLAGAARVLVDDLEFRVQVDLDARATVAGAERMSEIEATLFVPALKMLQSAIGTTLVGRRPTQWLQALAAIEATLRNATSQASIWVADVD